MRQTGSSIGGSTIVGSGKPISLDFVRPAARRRSASDWPTAVAQSHRHVQLGGGRPMGARLGRMPCPRPKRRTASLVRVAAASQFLAETTPKRAAWSLWMTRPLTRSMIFKLKMSVSSEFCARRLNLLRRSM